MAVRLFGKYEILKEVGRGGFGTVYLVRDTVLDVERALKVLNFAMWHDVTFVERFRREAQLTARLEHPHIVTVHDFGEEEGKLYIIMRYMAGGSLKERLKKQGHLPLEEVLRVAEEIAEGLAYAHEHQVVHRDLKPGNILFDAQGRAAIGDFGLAKALGSNEDSLSLSMSRSAVGTFFYMAPELFDGAQATPVTDQYAFACIIYEMLTGNVLFSGPTPAAVIMAHLRGPQFQERWPEKVPEGVREVLEQAVAQRPEERFEDIRAFMKALLAASTYRGVPSRDDYTEVVRPPLPNPTQREAVEDFSVDLSDVRSIVLHRVWRGHETAVLRVAFSPDGGLVASVAMDGVVRLWRTSDGKKVYSIRAGKEPVQSVSFSSNGGMIATGGDDGVIRVWSTLDGKLLQEIRAHGWIRDVVFSPDDTMLVWGGTGQVVEIWDLKYRQRQGNLKGHHGTINQIVFSSKGRYIASASDDHSAILWDVTTRERKAILKHSASVRGISFCHTKEGVITISCERLFRGAGWGCTLGALSLWQVPSGNLIRKWEGHSRWIRGVKCGFDDSFLVSVGEDGLLCGWQTRDSSCLFKDDVGKWFYSVDVALLGNIIVAGDQDGYLYLWRISEK